MTDQREAQGTGEPITVEETLGPKRYRNASEATYLEATHEVRFITDYERSDEESQSRDPFAEFDDPGEQIYDTLPFEQWAEEECSTVVAKHVSWVTQRRLETEACPGNQYEGDMMIGTRSPAADAETNLGAGPALTWTLTTYVDDDSGRTLDPPVAFEEVVAATPATATVSITFEGQEHTTTLPVIVVEETKQLPAQAAEFLPEEPPEVGGEYESIAAANEVLPFELRGPTYLPDSYRLIQVAVHEPSWFTDFNCMLVYDNERSADDDHLTITAHSADDPNVPGHPYGVDCEVTVNGRPGTYARTEHEIVGPLPPGVSDSAELQDGVLEFTDSANTYYYMIGPFEKDELVRIAASVE